MMNRAADSRPNLVYGKVTDTLNRPVKNIVVEIYDCDMRSWELLDKSMTDAAGKFRAHWQHSQLSGRGKKSADIGIRVCTQEKNTELFKSGIGELRFNAGAREEINITLTAAVPVEQVEFDSLLKDVSFLAGKVPVAELQENEKHQDISFVSKELEVSYQKIVSLVLAHRLQEASRADADFFYAILRDGSLLKGHNGHSIGSRMSVDIDSDDRLLLFDMALADPEKTGLIIRTAVDNKIIAADALKKYRLNIEILQKFRKEAESYYQGEHGEKTIRLLFAALEPGKIEKLQQLFRDNKNDLDTFFRQLSNPTFFDPEEKKDNGQLFRMSAAVLPGLLKQKEITQPKDLRRLARLNKVEWEKELKAANPGFKDQDTISNYASMITRRLEKEFPTTAFAAQLERESKPVLQNREKILEFLNKEEDFDFQKNNIDLFLKGKKMAGDDNQALANELKSVQRVFRLAPTYRKTMGLLHENISSSYDIVNAGKKRFVTELAPNAGIGEQEAEQIYKVAETRNTAAMLVVGDLQDTMSVMDIASFETTTLQKKLEAVGKDFPNLKSLFKLTDTCECEHCRSVYSPAAYLVQVLQFLDKRTVLAGNAKSVLFNRRPDLGEIDLGCANANTPVKYIDLVCELLEELIAPDEGIIYSGVLSDGADPYTGKVGASLLAALTTAGLPITENALVHATETRLPSSASLPHYLRDTKLVCRIVNTGGSNYKIYRLRQTFSTAEELDAAPEYVNQAAYTELNSKSFAFKLPFDLNHTEAIAFLKRFDVPRADLMRVFQNAGGPSNESVAAERLALTHQERKLIASSPAPNDNAAQQEFWNVPAPGDVVLHLKRVDHFLDRTGISFKELDLLLKQEFIDKNGDLFILHTTTGCDTATKEISNLDIDVLDRCHRFLRLQKKLKWKTEFLNAIIMQPAIGNGSLDDAFLVNAAILLEIAAKTKLKSEQLAGCFGEIPHTVYAADGPQPLYHQVFLNKAKNGIIDEGLLPEKVDGSQLISNFKGTIATSLQLKQKDLDLLLPLLPDDLLNFSNLSYLYASSLYIKKLRLKTEDFVLLVNLSGLNFTSSPAIAWQFIEMADDFGLSPFKAADVQFILRHEAVNLADRMITTDKVEEILGKLKLAYAKLNTTLASAFHPDQTYDEQASLMKTTLQGLVNGTADDPDSDFKLLDTDVDTVLGFFNREYTSAAAAKQFIDDKFDKKIKRSGIDTAIDALDAVAPGGDITAEQLALLEAFLEAIAAFNIGRAKKETLEQTIAAAFKAPADLAQTILTDGRLKQPAPGTAIPGELLLDDFINPVTALNYPDQYASLQWLHKLFYFINGLQLNRIELQWFLQNNKAMGWLEPDGIPYKPGQSAIGFKEYLSFLTALNFARTFTAVVNPADAESPADFFNTAVLARTGSVATKAELMDKLSLLTGYDKNDLSDIDAHLFAAFSVVNYQQTSNWERLFTAAEYLRKLGVPLSQAAPYFNAGLTVNEVNSLKAALKARYDEDTWLSTLKEIMDSIRPQKRDALVTYILSTNPGIKDENDLYEYLLIDVEMGACMPSSRIVQAHGAVQLFVQRCLMGLEPDAIANVDADPGWAQWTYLKNYRVAEANIKVFLYPENWYDVSLSDEMSFLLKESFNELQQNELTNDTAEQSLRNYLEKLDNLAFLEVMASWYDVPSKNMHVFARTKGGDPATYYYRRFEKERYWSPWEKVELDITGDHLLAFVRNNRLHLAWPIFSEKTNPDQESKVPSASDQGDHVPVDKPQKKLLIQLAISEFSNKKWQPKKISKEAIETPPGVNNYTTNLIPKQGIKLFYNQLFDQVICFNEESVMVMINEFEYEEQSKTLLAGAFDIAGCKGYPELAAPKNFSLDFIPRFRDTGFIEQRYKELDKDSTDDLTAQNVYSLFAGLDMIGILQQTPGRFRLSYPNQFTILDIIVLLMEVLLMQVYAKATHDRKPRVRIPMGTLLPYFKEDSNHAYVIIPGYYKRNKKEGFTDAEKRTASDMFRLTEDIGNWFKKLVQDLKDHPLEPGETLMVRIIKDPSFNNILQDISKYQFLDFVLQALIGLSGDPSFDEMLKKLRDTEGLEYGEQFKNMYHPRVCALRTVLYRDGIPGLMKRETQLFRSDKEPTSSKAWFNFQPNYLPNEHYIPRNAYKTNTGTEFIYPIEDVDFQSDGSYSLYNWDLFFRLPLYIAGNLTRNQRFEEAMKWFHYMFNPTGALTGNGVQKYWVTKPFYLNQDADYAAQRIDNILYALSKPGSPDIAELEFAVAEWKAKPFRPDVIARFRPVAYQKALLMAYIDNLVEWGDYLFRQDTMESIAQATQMYILADKLLGPKPRIVPPVVKQPYETYNQIEGKLDSFGNALIEMDNILPNLSVMPEGGDELPPTIMDLPMLYFCIPHNEKMMAYWERVADRLFKIRHCQNIDGIERSLALFAPPIDPGMLVKAAASGMDLASVIAGLNAPTPYYRFSTLVQKSMDLSQEVRALGNALLQVMEKRDAEAMALLRNELELKLLNAVRDMKTLQISESREQIEVLKRTKLVTQERQRYYAGIQKISNGEKMSLNLLESAQREQNAAQNVNILASVLGYIPNITVGASGFGGSPHVNVQWGTGNIISALQAMAGSHNLMASMMTYQANRASTLAGYDRRFDDWKLQERLAVRELASIDKQLAAAEIRKEIAETDLKNHDIQIGNSKKTDEFMRSKFTNKELYDWMLGQISSIYFSSYQLAHNFAKKAERSYRYELGNTDMFINYGYWDSLRKGLQSADNLIHDIKRMETSYLDKNKREYEITKHVSLSMLDPLALVKLRQVGVCDFDIPEALYDLDFPGQYFRRLKSVAVTFAAVAPPFTSVSARLSLVKNKYRKNINGDNAAGTGYAEDPGNDDRFEYNLGSIQSIATSNAQNDSGLFELNFRDERYLPFEGTGAISSWRLELPTEIRQFDYSTIADVVIHVKYTAREGGSSLKSLANTVLKQQLENITQALRQEGMHTAVNMKHELPNHWHLLKQTGKVKLTLDKSRLPYMAQTIDAEIEEVIFIASVEGDPASFSVLIEGDDTPLSWMDEIRMLRGTNSDIVIGEEFELSVAAGDKGKLKELLMIIKYKF